MFIAAGHNGQRIASADGLEWKNLQTGKEGEVYRGAAYGNGRFVAIATFGAKLLLARSTDGAKWDVDQKEIGYARKARTLAFANGSFIAMGGDPGSVGDSKPFILSSTDGVTWTDFKDINGKNILRRFAYGNGTFVAVGDRGRRAASTDAIVWKDVEKPKALDTLIDIAFGNGLFVGVGLHGLRMTTPDGITWSAPERGDEGEHLNSIVWADNRFVAVGAGATFTSPDGKIWQKAKNSEAPVTLCYGKGHFVGVGWKGRILHSTDAITWKEVHKCEHHLETVAFGG